VRDTGIGAATEGLAGVRVVRPASAGIAATGATKGHAGEFLMLFVLVGALGLKSETFGDHRLDSGDSCVLPGGLPYALTGESGLEMLEVTLPAELPSVGS
jgi:hypothetical protein